ncbi:hypothetical protein B0H13DRAFT_1874131 [Mycena leptocephala]|nr:hypothetical protein B0H13DRAFT_1874131 [Mycena leptocephala]
MHPLPQVLHQLRLLLALLISADWPSADALALIIPVCPCAPIGAVRVERSLKVPRRNEARPSPALTGGRAGVGIGVNAGTDDPGVGTLFVEAAYPLPPPVLAEGTSEGVPCSLADCAQRRGYQTPWGQYGSGAPSRRRCWGRWLGGGESTRRTQRGAVGREDSEASVSGDGLREVRLRDGKRRQKHLAVREECPALRRLVCTAVGGFRVWVLSRLGLWLKMGRESAGDGGAWVLTNQPTVKARRQG